MIKSKKSNPINQETKHQNSPKLEILFEKNSDKWVEREVFLVKLNDLIKNEEQWTELQLKFFLLTKNKTQ